MLRRKVNRSFCFEGALDVDGVVKFFYDMDMSSEDGDIVLLKKLKTLFAIPNDVFFQIFSLHLSEKFYLIERREKKDFFEFVFQKRANSYSRRGMLSETQIVCRATNSIDIEALKLVENKQNIKIDCKIKSPNEFFEFRLADNLTCSNSEVIFIFATIPVSLSEINEVLTCLKTSWIYVGTKKTQGESGHCYPPLFVAFRKDFLTMVRYSSLNLNLESHLKYFVELARLYAIPIKYAVINYKSFSGSYEVKPVQDPFLENNAVHVDMNRKYEISFQKKPMVLAAHIPALWLIKKPSDC